MNLKRLITTGAVSAFALLVLLMPATGARPAVSAMGLSQSAPVVTIGIADTTKVPTEKSILIAQLNGFTGDPADFTYQWQRSRVQSEPTMEADWLATQDLDPNTPPSQYNVDAYFVSNLGHRFRLLVTDTANNHATSNVIAIGPEGVPVLRHPRVDEEIRVLHPYLNLSNVAHDLYIDPAGYEYEFQVATAVSFAAGTVKAEGARSEIPTAENYGITYWQDTAHALLAGATYYWRARASVAGAPGNWSQPVRFTTSSTPWSADGQTWHWPLDRADARLTGTYGEGAWHAGFHRGLDIGVCGDDVRAAISGIVRQRGGGQHNTVRLQNPFDPLGNSLYLHMANSLPPSLPSLGTFVNQGTIIGQASDVGVPGSCHLHFQTANAALTTTSNPLSISGHVLPLPPRFGWNPPASAPPTVTRIYLRKTRFWNSAQTGISGTTFVIAETVDPAGNTVPPPEGQRLAPYSMEFFVDGRADYAIRFETLADHLGIPDFYAAPAVNPSSDALRMFFRWNTADLPPDGPKTLRVIASDYYGASSTPRDLTIGALLTPSRTSVTLTGIGPEMQIVDFYIHNHDDQIEGITVDPYRVTISSNGPQASFLEATGSAQEMKLPLVVGPGVPTPFKVAVWGCVGGQITVTAASGIVTDIKHSVTINVVAPSPAPESGTAGAVASSAAAETASPPICGPGSTSYPGLFYAPTVIGMTGQAGLQAIGDGVSINDSGTVAFTGRLAGGGNGLFVGDGTAGPRNINPSFSANPSRDFGDAVQINNSGQIVARDRVSGSPPRTFIRRWDAATPDSYTIVASGGGPSDPFDAVAGPPSTNDANQVAFAALKDATELLATSAATDGVALPFPLRPLIANDGRVVVLANSATNPAIRLYKADLTSSQEIAGVGAEWQALGRSPGISDDGQIVVFYGDLTAAGADALNSKQVALTYPGDVPLRLEMLAEGPGIFTSVDTAAGRVIQRVAGLGEGFSSFDADSRVGVNSTQSTQRGVTVVYIAFDKASPTPKKGIYAQRLSFFGEGSGAFDPKKLGRLMVTPPALVVKQDQPIKGLSDTDTVQDVRLFDPVNNRDRGDIAFWAKMATGVEAAVRARPREVVYLDFAPPANLRMEPYVTSLLADLGIPPTWHGTLATIFATLAPNRTELIENIRVIQDDVVDRVQAAFDDVDPTAPGQQGVNVKVLGHVGEAPPAGGPFIHVYVGDSPFFAGNPSTIAGATRSDLFNRGVSDKLITPVYRHKTPLIYADNIFRMSSENFSDEQGEASRAIDLADTGPAQITLDEVKNALASTIAHELGHALGAMHLDTDLNTLIMNATISTPLGPDISTFDELRRSEVFTNSQESLDPGRFPPDATENSAARLAFAVGSDVDPGVLPRDPPGAAVLTEQREVFYRLGMAVSATAAAGVAAPQAAGPITVTAAALGVIPGGDAHAAPVLIDLGSGELPALLNRVVPAGERDQIFMVAATSGDGVDVFGTVHGFAGDPATMDLSDGMAVLSDPRLRGDLVDGAGNPAPVSLDLYQTTVSGTLPIGQFGVQQIITAPLRSIAISPADPSLVRGSQLQLAAIGTFDGGSTGDMAALAAWTSSDPAVATVGQAGLVMAIAPGVTTITAKVDGIQGSTVLTVTEPPAAFLVYLPLTLRSADGPAPTPTATSTATPTATGTSTPTATATRMPTATGTSTPTGTPTATRTATLTPTSTGGATATPTPTATRTQRPTWTFTPTATPSPSATPTASPTPSYIRWIAHTSGAWNDPANWDLGRLPGQADTVVIDVPEVITVTLSDPGSAIYALQSKEALVVARTLLIASASEISNTLTLTGNLSGPGVLTVKGMLTWTGGYMSGAGKTVAAGGLALGPGTTLERTLDNAGPAIFNGPGSFRITVYGRLNNLPGAVFEVRGGGDWPGYDGGCLAATFSNQGAFRKPADGAALDVGITFDNAGTLEVAGGSLRLRGCSNSGGRFLVSQDATLEIGGLNTTQTLTATSEITGSGNVTFIGARATLGGLYDLDGVTTIRDAVVAFDGSSPATTRELHLTGQDAILEGAGDLSVVDLLNWTVGTMRGSGQVINQFQMAINGPGGKNLSGRVLVNEQTATWSGANIALWHGAMIQNNGWFYIQGDVAATYMQGYGGALPTINNANLLRKSAGAGVAQLEVIFNNSGAVDVQSGTLRLVRGGSTSGAFTGAAGGTIELATNYTLDASSSVSDVNVKMSIGSVDVQGAYHPLSTTIESGTTTFHPQPGSRLGALTVTGVLTLNNTTPITATTALLTGGGYIQGAGNLDVTGTFNWNGGFISGSGDLSALGGLRIDGPAGKLLHRRRLRSYGASTWKAGPIALGNNAIIENHGTFDIQTDETMDRDYAAGTGLRFDNFGVLRKSAGSGVTQINYLPLNNTGTVDVQIGTLWLAGWPGVGVSSGLFTGAPAGTLEFASAHTLDAGSTVTAPNVRVTGGPVAFAGAYAVADSTTVSGAGVANFVAGAHVTSLGSQVTLNGGTLDFSTGAPVSLPNLDFVRGTLSGSDSVTVTNVLTWTEGTMTGAGKTTVMNSLVMTSVAGGGNTKSLGGSYALENRGAATWDGSNFDMSGQAVFNNATNATFTAQGDGRVSNGTFNNTGAFRKTGGAGLTAFESGWFNNSGTVEVQTGTLRVAYRGGTASGPFTGAAGTALEFWGGTYTLNPGSSLSIPHVLNYQATVNINTPVTVSELVLNGDLAGTGDVTVTGKLTLNGGRMTGPGKTISNGDLAIAGGLYLDGRELVNNGQGVWGDGTGSEPFFWAFRGAVVRNAAGATLNIPGGGGLGFCDAYSSPVIVWSCGQNIGPAPTFVNEGTIVHSGSSTFSLLANHVQECCHYGPVPFVNTGTVRIEAGTMAFEGFTQGAGVTSLTGGSIIAWTPLDIQGGVLSGAGSIFGSVSNAGTIEVGEPGLAGTLAITTTILAHFPPDGPIYVPGGNYAQTAAGTLKSELGGPNPGTQHDQLQVKGSATLNGTLDVRTFNSYTPPSGATYQVLTYGSRSGVFATVNGNGQTYSTSYGATSLTLTYAWGIGRGRLLWIPHDR